MNPDGYGTFQDATTRRFVGYFAGAFPDEATTALDPGTEAEICQTLVKLKEQVTILAISHQAAMRDVADVTYEIANGTVRRMDSRRRSMTTAAPPRA